MHNKCLWVLVLICCLMVLVPFVSLSAEWVGKDIESLFWFSDDYMLNVKPEDGEFAVTIYLTDPEESRFVKWQFPCDYKPETESLQASGFTLETLSYDDSNLLQRNIEPDASCETSFHMNDRGGIEVRHALDECLEGRTFLKEADTEALLLKHNHVWWITDTPNYESWMNFRPVMVSNDAWFWIYKMPGNVYALFEPYQSEEVISYLILGEEKALLWDTGMGISNIRNCVMQLTDLPITVLNSHSHYDHTGGNYLFEQVMCYNDDDAVQELTDGISHDDVLIIMDPYIVRNAPEDYSPETFCRIGKTPTGTVDEGDIIDLGGRKLEVIYTPGHLSSCIMLIDEQNSILFTGDTWYPGPLYVFEEESDMSDYMESMYKVGQMIRERNIQWLYGSHNEVLPGTELFFETIDFLEDVIHGEAQYKVEDELRRYRMDERIGLYLALDEETEN